MKSRTSGFLTYFGQIFQLSPSVEQRLSRKETKDLLCLMFFDPLSFYPFALKKPGLGPLAVYLPTKIPKPHQLRYGFALRGGKFSPIDVVGS